MAILNIIAQFILTCLATVVSFLLIRPFVNALITGAFHYGYFLCDTLGCFGKNERQCQRHELAYITPWVTNIYITMLFFILALCVEPKLHPAVMLVFPLLMIPFYIGMWRRYSENKEKFERVISLNLEFLDLCKVPISFLSAVIGAELTMTGLGLKSPYELVKQLISFYDRFFIWYLKLLDWDISRFAFYHISRIPLLWLWGYIISLPFQWLSMWILPAICHSKADMKPFLQIGGVLFGKSKGVKPIVDSGEIVDSSKTAENAENRKQS